MVIAIYNIKKPTTFYNSDSEEATMKKVVAAFEDLWVAVAFAEAGAYEPVVMQDLLTPYQDRVSIHTA
jgi:hypothetical protein